MITGLPVRSYPSLPPDIRHWEDHALFLKLNKVIGRACAGELHRRYQSAGILLKDLQQVL